MRVISRFTSFLAAFGSSAWSHSAAVRPARMSLARYVSTAIHGTPHIGMPARCVSVTPSIGAASTASRPNIS